MSGQRLRSRLANARGPKCLRMLAIPSRHTNMCSPRDWQICVSLATSKRLFPSRQANICSLRNKQICVPWRQANICSPHLVTSKHLIPSKDKQTSDSLKGETHTSSGPFDHIFLPFTAAKPFTVCPCHQILKEVARFDDACPLRPTLHIQNRIFNHPAEISRPIDRDTIG